MERTPPAVLSIAGSDSGGGAGIQADLKAFAAAGAHGLTAITALTAQSTVGVEAIHRVPATMIVGQVRAVAEDIGVDAVKVGMLGDVATIEAVVESLGLVAGVPIVVDPVMVSESGAVLLEPEARQRLVEDLLPMASVVTPNIAEAAVLCGGSEQDKQAELAAAVRALGPAAALVTGGHTEQGADLLDDGGREPLVIRGEIHRGGAVHGSGCTHSSTLAALLAHGLELRAAAIVAREVAATAVAQGLAGIGAGPGPVDVLGVAARRPA
jgi:hydroxymethylpyrimidine/phosphomethylpyrimidine kinase